MPSEYYAHTDPSHPGKGPDEPGVCWQTLEDHLRQTAQLARGFAAAFGAGDWGHIAGLLHDLGKYSHEFQQMLRAAADAHIEQTSKVQHSIIGAQQSTEKWKQGEGKILAYAIAGHHTGLADGRSNEESSLAKRLQKELPYDFNWPDELLEVPKPDMPFTLDKMRAGLEVSFFIRMLFSALVDADFLDTEKHMKPQQAVLRSRGYSLVELEGKLTVHLDSIEQQAASTTVNRLRSQILNNCRKAARLNRGLFSLTVPTGGGKTLSSLTFALKHAIKCGQNRIIYVIPFTSIIEQNAAIFRDIFGDDNVLEHHSNYEPVEEEHRTRLASENWDAPIVVTTNVQFFESLFACRSSRSRKLHNIANSVIIMDEVQALPSELLLPCIEAIRELALNYQCSLVLCSATQPAIQRREDFSAGLADVREIAEDPDRLAGHLKRTTVFDLGEQSDDLLIERIRQHEKVLCVVNTRKHALRLYEQLAEEVNVFHLSASLCPVDRSRILHNIRETLKEQKPCRVISTQLVEAGVDIDFPVVYRAIAGIDSIAQAAGRCNREGLLESGAVFIFRPEHKLPPGYFRQTAQTTESVMRRFSEDVLSLSAIEEYFRDYYWSQGERLDNKGILQLLREGALRLNFPFREVANRFRLIEDDHKPVIVPRDAEAEKLIQQIRYADCLRGFSRKLQKYTVQINQREWDRLRDAGCLDMVHETFPVLTCPHLYHEKTGLNLNKLDNPDPNDLIS
ncbi:MAG: CRISPR-associated helicase Cas3' [Planctomycetes bacterium]|nr:CRISPR-associated helicase Cas3' [Planctomycetota bacterium]